MAKINKNSPVNSAKVKEKKQNPLIPYLMLSPQIIGLIVFTIYPIIWVFRYAFYDYDGIRASFIGMENFVRIFTRDPEFWKSVLNTIILAYGKLIIEIPLALIIALVLVSPKLKFKKLFLIGYRLPSVTGVAVNCMIFLFLFNVRNGIVNKMLLDAHMIAEPINWFGTKWGAMFVIMLESLWEGFAANVLYFMAGVGGISDEVLEAADIDGANRFQKFTRITVPMLAPVVRTVLLLAMVSGMQIMNSVMLLTNGGPAGSTDVVMLRIYKMFFVGAETPQYGYASAMGIVTTVIIGILTVIYLKFSQKADEV